MRTSIQSRSRRLFATAGFMIIALGASTGIVTSSTSWASGVSVNSDAQMMANDASSYPLQFDAAVQNSFRRDREKNPQRLRASVKDRASVAAQTASRVTPAARGKSGGDVSNQHFRRTCWLPISFVPFFPPFTGDRVTAHEPFEY